MIDNQSVLAPAGADAAVIATLGWIMFAGAGFIILIVLGFALAAFFGGESVRRRLAGDWFVFFGGAIFPLVTLTTLLIYGLLLTRERIMHADDAPLHIEVTGEQWWWRVRYQAEGAVTANEIRIPVGRGVEIELKSADVIHSFWVPSLAGKVDMIPGITTRLRLIASAPGNYRGQCAEYCGGPHALMALHVIAVEPAEFASWLARLGAPAGSPIQEQGMRLFMSTGCHACHAIRGTEAEATIGPDLTHVGGRRSLAAGTLSNDATSFVRWIRDNQHIKPNNRMPPFGTLPDRDLEALGAFLESLQ